MELASQIWEGSGLYQLTWGQLLMLGVGLLLLYLAIAREFYGKLGFVFVAGPVGPEPAAIVEHPSGVNINFILNAGTAMT